MKTLYRILFFIFSTVLLFSCGPTSDRETALRYAKDLMAVYASSDSALSYFAADSNNFSDDKAATRAIHKLKTLFKKNDSLLVAFPQIDGNREIADVVLESHKNFPIIIEMGIVRLPGMLAHADGKKATERARAEILKEALEQRDAIRIRVNQALQAFAHRYQFDPQLLK